MSRVLFSIYHFARIPEKPEYTWILENYPGGILPAGFLSLEFASDIAPARETSSQTQGNSIESASSV